ncbi:hypothetical protein [Streptomyces yanii]|uniref:hypothetical protein n=1 Tax=Streptomyces yanii TaxID=78510 RepID=UPI003CD061BC
MRPRPGLRRLHRHRAATAFTRLDTRTREPPDVFAKVTADNRRGQAPVGASYANRPTHRLARGGRRVQLFVRQAVGATGGDDARFWQPGAQADDGSVRVGVCVRAVDLPRCRSNGARRRRADLPWAKFFVTPDANGDKTVDWQTVRSRSAPSA